MQSERLDNRKEKILASIVDLYTETSRPVGSAAVAAQSGLGVSAATIRNDMRALEDAGLIEQPHTSAGRVPTERGYRYYVDYLLNEQKPPRSWSATLSKLFDEKRVELDELLFRASRLVSEATHQAAVVVGPYPEDEVLGDVHLSVISDGSVLISLITSSGRAVLGTARMGQPISSEVIERVEQLAKSFKGTPIAEIGGAFGNFVVGGEVGPEYRSAVSSVFSAMAQEIDRVVPNSVPYYVGGTSWVARGWPTEEWGEFEGVLRALEEQKPVISALRRLSDEGALSVFIGSENPSKLLRSCSIVAGSIVADSKVVGSVGVVGSTRMNYRRVLPVVRDASARIGHWLVSAYG